MQVGPNAELIQMSIDLEVLTGQVFRPEDVGGDNWVLVSHDSRGTWVVNGDYGLVHYLPGAWELLNEHAMDDSCLGGEWQVPDDYALETEDGDLNYFAHTLEMVREHMGEPETVTVRVEVTFTQADLKAGWAGDRSECEGSILARLDEVIGDDGGAYVPEVHVV